MKKKIKELENTRLLAIRRGLFDRASMVEARIKNLKIAQKTLTLIKQNEVMQEWFEGETDPYDAYYEMFSSEDDEDFKLND